jgi:HK97 family phage prohead protease
MATRAKPTWAKDLRRDGDDLRVRAVNDEERTVELSFSSETPVDRWGEAEILSHAPDAVDLRQLTDIGVALFNHDPDRVVGKVTAASVGEDRRGYATVRFDDDEASLAVFRKVAHGTLRGVSVGYRVGVWEQVKAGAKSADGSVEGPAWIAKRWTPLEVSIVSVPADASVGVGRSDNNDSSRPLVPGDDEQNTLTKGEATMAEEITERAEERAPASPENAGTQVDTERERAAERLRIAEIVELCEAHKRDSSSYIKRNATLADVQRDILDGYRKANPVVPQDTERAEVRDESVEKFARAGADAILLRAGMPLTERDGKSRQAEEGADELRGMSLKDLACDYLRLRGKDNPSRLSIRDLMRAVFTPDSQFASMTDNVANKAMMVGHMSAGTTYQAWTGKATLADFKAAKAYRISEAGGLELLPQGAEFKHDAQTDESVSRSLLTYGRTWSLTRQAIINDDLDVMTKQPAAYARAARRGVNAAVYAILNSNTVCSYDSVALFHTATHGNLAGTGAAPSVTTIGAGRAAMARQKDIRSLDALNVVPRFIVAPPDLYATVKQLTRSIADPDGLNAGVFNPEEGALTSVFDAALTDTIAWYLFGAPSEIDQIEVAYLNGQEAPTIESAVDFDVLGMKWRIYHDYAVSILDHRGAYKNPGSSGGGS